MEKRNFIGIIYRMVCGLCFLALSACAADDLIEVPGNSETPQEPGLYFSLVSGSDLLPVTTRAASEYSLNETLVTALDIFLFKGDGTLNEGGYKHGEPDGNGVVMLYQGSNWKSYFVAGETYTVYVLANYKGDAKLSEVKTLDELKAVRAEDENIVFWKGMTGYSEDKTFLMDGHEVVDQTLFPADNTPYIQEVKLYRAAVKVEVTVNLSEEWAGQFTPSDLEAQVTNYATVTAALAEGNPIDDATQRGYRTYPTGNEDVRDNFTENFVRQKGEQGAVSGSTILFYAYVNRWDDLATNETMLLIDMPGTFTDTSEGGLEHNFYKIPIIKNTEEQVLERNTYYKITATVNMEGTSDIDEPQELTDVHFETAEWKEESVDVGAGDSPEYLVLSTYHLDLRNADGYDDLRFYSSSAIKSVEFVDGRTALDDADVNFDFDYPGTPRAGEDEIPAIYFVNKDGERQSVDEDDPNGDGRYNEDKVSTSYDQGVVEGNIHLVSTNPENVTKRYITLKVTNNDDISKYVVVEQYPLEYIQPIQGYYSYRDDFLSPDDSEPANTVVHWEQEFTAVGTARASQRRTRRWISEGIFDGYWSDWTEEEPRIVSYDAESLTFPTSITLPGAYQTFFSSKVYDEGDIYYYDFSSDTPTDISLDDPGWVWEDWPRVGNTTRSQTRYATLDGVEIPYRAERGRSSGNSNAMMYFVTITQTSGDYKIAHPVLEEINYGTQANPNYQTVAVSSRENDELISPSFMLASQLGAVWAYGLNWARAREHCSNYVETYIDSSGKTQHLTDWRLPTTSEIDVIIEYQNRAEDVMSTVLAGSKYYVAWSGADGDGTANVPSGNGSTAVRCIRDVKPNDAFLQSNN